MKNKDTKFKSFSFIYDALYFAILIILSLIIGVLLNSLSYSLIIALFIFVLKILYENYKLEKIILDFNSNSLDNYPKKQRLRRFISQCIQNHMNIGCKLSYYSSWPNNYDSYDCIEGSLSDFEIQIPENCTYIPYKKVYIPVLTKISEPSEKDKQCFV